MLDIKKICKKIDLGLIIPAFLLFCIGVFSIYSSTHPAGFDGVSLLFYRQLLWFIIGVIGMFLVIKVGSQRIIEWGYLIYLVSLVLLLGVFIVGVVRGGGHRWIRIGAFNFQPSEFVKLGVIIMAVRFFSAYKNDYFGFTKSIFFVTLISIPIILIALQPDLGTAIIFIPIILSIWFISDLGRKYLYSFIAFLILNMPLMWIFLRDYQKQRLLVFIKPDLDPLGAGYTVIQSKIAIGSGRFFGRGFLSGTQNTLNFLPERHTDFIFSVMGEEWGFIGSFIILGLFIYLINRAFNIALRANIRHDKMLAIGISVLLSLHVLINIGMTMGIMPAVGLPLPFISYGGSNLVVSMLSVALLLDIKSRLMS